MLTLPLLILQLVVGQQVSWFVRERIAVAWRSGSAPYELAIESSPRGDSSRIRIEVAGRPDFVFVNDTGALPFKEIKDLGAWNADVLKYRTTLTSKYFYFSAVLHGRHGTPILLVFGQGFEDEPDRLIVIGLDDTGLSCPALPRCAVDRPARQCGWRRHTGDRRSRGPSPRGSASALRRTIRTPCTGSRGRTSSPSCTISLSASGTIPSTTSGPDRSSIRSGRSTTVRLASTSSSR